MIVGMGQRAEAKFKAEMAVLYQRLRDWAPLTIDEYLVVSQNLLMDLEDAQTAWEVENKVHRLTHDQLLGQIKAKDRLQELNLDLNKKLGTTQREWMLQHDKIADLTFDLKRLQWASWIWFGSAVMFAAVAVLK